MNTVSRRSVLSTIFSGALASLALAGRAKAAPQQPHMQAALDSLRTAQRELKDADRDKGGHRERAVRLVQQAISEVEKGMRYDRRH